MTNLQYRKTGNLGKSWPPGPKSVIVYGPQGCGKTTHAAALARHFGLRWIHDDNHVDPRQFARFDTLYLINDRPEGPDSDLLRRCHSFADAMRMAGIQ